MNAFNDGWGMGYGWIIGFIILVVLVLLIWLVIKVVNQNHKLDLPNNKSPLDVLKDRYAKGEIGKEEFNDKMKGLK